MPQTKPLTTEDAEARLAAAQAKAEADPRTAQAAAIRERSEQLRVKSDKLRDDSWTLQSAARDLEQEAKEDAGVQEAADALQQAQAYDRETRDQQDQQRLLRLRKSYLENPPLIMDKAAFSTFCALGLPGLTNNDRPISFAEDDKGEYIPKPAKALPVVSKNERFVIRTAETTTTYSTESYWVAFLDGRPVAFMEAQKYARARTPDGQELLTAKGETALPRASYRRADSPKRRFEVALDNAFPEA